MYVPPAQLKFELFDHALLAPIDGHELSADEAFVSSFLLTARGRRPYTINEIVEAMKTTACKKTSDRRVKGIVRALRQQHGFPIISTKHPPYGYWWCQSTDEMQAFIDEFRSQAMDQLKTLSVMVKRNYPALAGQLKFEETR
jgi:hypothetical protein